MRSMKQYSILLFVLLTGGFCTAQTSYPADLFVAQDGSAQYTTIQEAVNAVRDLSQQQVRIHIKKGIYHEKLIIPSWKTKIALIGEDRENTVITNGDYSGKPNPSGKDLFGRAQYSTYTSYTVLVQGNDFVAENLTIINSSGRVGQAVALHVEGDRCIIRNCTLSGNQDTLYAATENSRQLYDSCYISGTTDFIFGEATAVFRNCTINSLTDSYITAAATTPRQQYGFVFIQCKLTAEPGVTKVFLGRPWRAYAKTVFINTMMGSHIIPEGWNPWKGDLMFPEKEKTAYYAEYNNSGPGASVAHRVAWAKQLTLAEANTYTVLSILAGKDNWQPLPTLQQP